ncbi:MAG: hypothetical protein JWR09_2026 [Mucilaginibacter sp.]|nr:hypothetical protein [Mucilaginibacter sp.]
MLKNELYTINLLIEEFESDGFCNDHCKILVNPDAAVLKACQSIREAWSAAMFSVAPDHSLSRYFHYHQEGIREISDTLSGFVPQPAAFKLLNKELIALIDFQQKFFGNFFNQDAVAPTAYHCNVVERLGDAIILLQEDLGKAFIDGQLKDCLLSYFEKMMPPGERKGFTFRSLFYFETLVLELHAMNLAKAGEAANRLLERKLTELNFNQIDFLIYRQQQTRLLFKDIDQIEKLNILNAENAALKLLPRSSMIYDSDWPSFSVMFSGWLAEEITDTEMIIQREANYLQEKLPLNLSVAHLACFLKLFFDEHLFKNSSLKDVFKFMSRNFETKRQPVISAGSLSKEFYSTGQVTAAVVRDMLQKMVARIDRSFFPVLVVIAVRFFVY